MVDNEPELIFAGLTEWCEENDIRLVYIKPGKAQQNGFVERFNGFFRREYLFESLTQLRDMAWFWLVDYNEDRTQASRSFTASCALSKTGKL